LIRLTTLATNQYDTVLVIRTEPSSRDAQAEDVPLPLSEAEKSKIRQALKDLLASPSLRSTQQCQLFLQYIVDHTLTGESALLRERVIGKEVFGRRPDYEPGEDPVVRLRAVDLRKRLAIYYQSLPGSPNVRIDVPPGSYKAVFTWNQPANPNIVHPVEEPVEIQPSQVDPSVTAKGDPHDHIFPAVIPTPAAWKTHPPSRWAIRYWLLLALTAILVAGVAFGAAWYRERGARTLHTFWSPFLGTSKTVLISIGSNAVYRVGDAQVDEYIRQHGITSGGMEFFPIFAPDQTLASTGLYPASDSFVALGDVAAASETVRTLTHFGQDFEERFPNDISFAEVRDHPTILIGGFNNPTTLELTRTLPFVLSGRNRIVDRTAPNRSWELHASTDSHDTEDYAVLSRLLGAKEVAPLVSVAGLGQYGTLAATELISKPGNLDPLIVALGPKWASRNFQAVLRIKVVDFKPVSTVVVATHSW
jgi:hypothetical protein